MKKVLITNQKGGVGKTTLTRNLGWYLASLGIKVLLVDSDAQGNLSKSFFEDEQLSLGLYEALEGGTFQLQEVRPNLSLLCGDKRLALLEKRFVAEIDGYLRLRDLLARSEFDSFEFALIDSPPSLGMMTANGLVASDFLLVPLSASVFSMQGTNDLLETAGKVMKSFNPGLKFLGAVLNCFDGVPLISREIRSEIIESFGDHAFSTVISKSIRVEEAAARHVGVSALSGPGTLKIQRELAALAEEFFQRLSYERA